MRRVTRSLRFLPELRELTNGGTNVILGPVTVTAVLHALYENTRAHTENAPMVITEDNQQSQVRVVTRTPIVVSTVTVSNGVSNIANDVRYYLDPSDVAKNREIGTTLYVTPSILPDNTIRLQIDGTVAAQVGTVLVPTGSTIIPSNSYPIVNEAHLVNLSRVPSGYSLILGGFVTVSNSVSNNKVPILGSIPLLGQAFRFKSSSRTRTNLAFIITPVAFQAGEPPAIGRSQRTRPRVNHWSSNRPSRILICSVRSTITRRISTTRSRPGNSRNRIRTLSRSVHALTE